MYKRLKGKNLTTKNILPCSVFRTEGEIVSQTNQFITSELALQKKNYKGTPLSRKEKVTSRIEKYMKRKISLIKANVIKVVDPSITELLRKLQGKSNKLDHNNLLKYM